MHKATSYKAKQFFFVLIKLSLVLGAFYFIYYKLTQNEDLDLNLFLDILITSKQFSLENIAFLVLLSSVNWVLEIKKWEILVGGLSKINFNKASQQTLGALTASLLTPNRIGDYGAKALYYHPEDRTKIILLNLFGNTMQMIVTLVFGSIGFLILAKDYELPINLEYLLNIVLAVIVGLIILYRVSTHNFFKNSVIKLHQFVLVLKRLSTTIKRTILLLSVLRYLVFSFQFYFIIILFGVEISYIEAMIFISTMYLLSSILPSILVFDVVLKSSIAVYLFALIDVDPLSILSTTTLMWILNFVLPSIVGSYFVLKFKPVKTR
ncbi:MAG: flippase-like domain-containing protein [Bizionia sp.]|nr:flippase-like domain-containing protein [Bizionia sp.]